MVDWDRAEAFRRRLADEGKTVVFTNGIFDLIHRGHVELLERARSFGDALIVGINSDASTTRLKGPSRPYTTLEDRAAILAALRAVDCVVTFEEDTPAELIERLRPDVLVKGADYETGEIVGRETVEKHGGRVERVALVEGRSTTGIVQEILRRTRESEKGSST